MAIQKFGVAVPTAVSTPMLKSIVVCASDGGKDAQPERESQGQQEG